MEDVDLRFEAQAPSWYDVGDECIPWNNQLFAD